MVIPAQYFEECGAINSNIGGRVQQTAAHAEGRGQTTQAYNGGIS